jgi:hypothetical protein
MARKKKLDFSDIATTRKKANLNQIGFLEALWRHAVGWVALRIRSEYSEAIGDPVMAASVREGDGQGSGGCFEIVGSQLPPKLAPKLLAARLISVRMSSNPLGATLQPTRTSDKAIRQADGPWICGQIACGRTGRSCRG